MNYPGYDGYPWANRPDHEALRPLPADVRTLRQRYPEAGSRAEVAVLNTWFDATDPSESGAAYQQHLCQPSLGSGWSLKTSAGTCGTNGADQGSTEICTGDTLRTRFALANYSTEAVDVVSGLWFSLHDQWDSSDGVVNLLKTRPTLGREIGG